MSVTREIAIERATDAFNKEVFDARQVQGPGKNRQWQVQVKSGCVKKWVKLPTLAQTRRALEARGEDLGQYAHAWGYGIKRGSRNHRHLVLLKNHHDRQVSVTQNVFGRPTIPCPGFGRG